MHLRLQSDSLSFHPVHPLIREFGPRVLHQAEGRGRDALSDNDIVSLKIVLRRKSFDSERMPEGYNSASQVLNMSYADQVSYINKLSNSRVSEWYGASDAI